ncbi:hypothetical protein EVAR_66596_1 [Eumeta japonica]|uniref:Uncharacterized protein n=1 Tax=Eumeta variegata TaxID=151549 RepID=A0A4C1ZU20_EUMVA|nr:hypothetical protein EVAR_66596_1 [Eumeta japonica]
MNYEYSAMGTFVEHSILRKSRLWARSRPPPATMLERGRNPRGFYKKRQQILCSCASKQDNSQRASDGSERCTLMKPPSLPASIYIN